MILRFLVLLFDLPAIVRLRRTPRDYARDRQARRAGIQYFEPSALCRLTLCSMPHAPYLLIDTMTEVIFLEVSQSRMESRACELAEEIYARGSRVQIIALDQEQAERLDDLLWTFKPETFIPHALWAGTPSEPTGPVIITPTKEAVEGMDSLVMMGYGDVDLVSQFSQAYHLVVVDNHERLDGSRGYWTLLKDAGFSLRHQSR